MLWRTVVLAAVNAVTVLLVFVPIMSVTAPGCEEALFLHSHSSPYLFLIQAALGIFAVAVDMLNKKERLQSKLLAAGTALSLAFAGVILWLALTTDSIGCFVYPFRIQIGAWIPFLNVVFFGIVWYNQRKRAAVKK